MLQLMEENRTGVKKALVGQTKLEDLQLWAY